MMTKEKIKPVSKSIKNKIDALNKQAWKIHITKPKDGLRLSSEAKNLSEKNGYESGLAYAIRNMGVSNRYLSNLEKALKLSFEALEMFELLDDKSGKSQALTSIGAIYYYMGDYQQGLDYFLQGLRLGDEIGNKEAMAYGYNGAGYIYSLLGDAKKGHDFLQNALDLSREINNFDLESSILDSIAVSYFNNKEFDKAYETNLTTVQLCEKNNEKRNLGYALFGIGKIMIIQKKLNDAKEYFLRSLKIHKGIGYPSGMADSLLNIGQIYFEEKDFDQAIKYFKESLDVAKSIKANAAIYKAHEAFSNLYESTKDFDNFIYHYKLYHKFKSEVFKEELESKQKFLALQHEMEKVKQESEINRLTNVVMKEKNAELEKKTKELEQSYSNVSVISKIGQDITSTLSLETILTTVYKNVNELMDATVFGIGTYNPVKKIIEYRMSIEKGMRYQPYQRSMTDKNQFPVWCIENKKEVFINDIQKEYSKYLPNIDLTILTGAEMEDGSMPESPNSLIYLPLMAKEKIIGLLSVQSYKKNAYTVNHLNMLKTLASYTAAALYNAQSFETLQNTLSDLKMTQAQLVHSEKMASLGELTAGIAHEIQNPLNFVNNFSDVNRELAEELLVELEKGNGQEAQAIIKDIIENEGKVIHHGKRAEEIVKSMLQHSRGTEGKKEPTDINTLCDEYLRLAYHGFRAKDKSFNADFMLELDESLPKIKVVPQDIGRVLLNLINNAFHAVSQPAGQAGQKSEAGSGSADYKPMVTIFTKLSPSPRGIKGEENIQISIKDNGPGIPDDIMDKIFQPFFSTKPTGQGTGLGLSLSYDIVTKGHGGTIDVKSKVGKGTEFVIRLPVE